MFIELNFKHSILSLSQEKSVWYSFEQLAINYSSFGLTSKQTSNMVAKVKVVLYLGCLGSMKMFIKKH